MRTIQDPRAREAAPGEAANEQQSPLPIVPPGSDGQSWWFEFEPANDAGAWHWRHYDLVNVESRRTIEADPGMPEFARQALLSTDDTPRVVTDGDVVAGVLPSFARTGDADAYDLTYWHFSMTPERLITGRRQATRTLYNMWAVIRGGRKPRDPATLLDLCIGEFAREVRARLKTLAATLHPVEDNLIAERADLSEVGARLGNARREAVQLRRALAPLHRAFDEDMEELPEWAQFDDHHSGVRLLHSALDDITALQDHARSLQDEFTTRLAEESNRRLYMVSVVTTLAVPGTFITGFFGMNTGGMVWSGEQAWYGTLFAGMVCATAILGTLLILRLKRLL